MRSDWRVRRRVPLGVKSWTVAPGMKAPEESGDGDGERGGFGGGGGVLWGGWAGAGSEERETARRMASFMDRSAWLYFVWRVHTQIPCWNDKQEKQGQEQGQGQIQGFIAGLRRTGVCGLEDAEGDDGHVVVLFGLAGEVVGLLADEGGELGEGGEAQGADGALELRLLPELFLGVTGLHDAVRDDDEGCLRGRGGRCTARRRSRGRCRRGGRSGEAVEGAVRVEDGGDLAGVDVGEGGAVGGDEAAEEGGVTLGGGAVVEGLVEVGEDLAEGF